MKSEQLIIIQKRFSLLMLIFCSIVIISNIFRFLLLKKMSFFILATYTGPTILVALMFTISLLFFKQSSKIFAIQIIVTFVVGSVAIATNNDVNRISGDLIFFLGTIMLLVSGYIKKHFKLKIFFLFVFFSILKAYNLLVLLDKRDDILLYINSFIIDYALLVFIVLLIWTLIRDQINDYVELGKGLENRLTKNKVFIDIGKIGWSFLHNLGDIEFVALGLNTVVQKFDNVLLNKEKFTDETIEICYNMIKSAKNMMIKMSHDRNQIRAIVENKFHTEKKLIELNIMIKDYISYIRITNIAKSIKIILDLSTDNIYIYGSPFEILQSFENIVNNCIDAMKANNSILSIRTNKNNGWAEIFITDTGGGISFVNTSGNVNLDEFKIGRTTKEERGTGWGMYSTIQYIKQNDGHLYIDTLKGVGTTFFIKFKLGVEK